MSPARGYGTGLWGERLSGSETFRVRHGTPVEPGSRKVVGATGFDPATPCAQGRIYGFFKAHHPSPSGAKTQVFPRYFDDLRCSTAVGPCYAVAVIL